MKAKSNPTGETDDIADRLLIQKPTFPKPSQQSVGIEKMFLFFGY